MRGALATARFQFKTYPQPLTRKSAAIPKRSSRTSHGSNRAAVASPRASVAVIHVVFHQDDLESKLMQINVVALNEGGHIGVGPSMQTTRSNEFKGQCISTPTDRCRAERAGLILW